MANISHRRVLLYKYGTKLQVLLPAQFVARDGRISHTTWIYRRKVRFLARNIRCELAAAAQWPKSFLTRGSLSDQKTLSNHSSKRSNDFSRKFIPH